MDSEKHNALKSLISSLPAYIDGKKLLIEMKQNNLPNWKQKEFISFEIERLCLKYLESFGFEPKKAIYDGIDHGKVKIDTFKDYPIDIKTSFDSKGCILNDKNTMDKIIKQYGCFGIIKIVCKANKDDNYERFGEFADDMKQILDIIYVQDNDYLFYNYNNYRVVDGKLTLKDGIDNISTL